MPGSLSFLLPPPDTNSTGDKWQTWANGIASKLCASKATINRMKRQPTEWETFAPRISQKGLIPRIRCLCFPWAVTCHQRVAEAHGGGAGRQSGEEAPPVSQECGKAQVQAAAGLAFTFREVCEDSRRCGEDLATPTTPAPRCAFQPSFCSSCRAESHDSMTSHPGLALKVPCPG